MREANPGTSSEIDRIFEELAENQKLAHSSAVTTRPVLAAFDVATGAVWSNDAMAHAIARFRRTGRRLRDEDVETLAHEFARVLDYEDILESCSSHRQGIALMTKRLARDVSRSTAETYANRTLVRARIAEEWVQKIHMEIISNFDRTQKGSGLSGSAISGSAEDRAIDWMARTKDDYRRKARREYDRLLRAQSDGYDEQDPYSLVWADPLLEQVFIKSIAGMFPLELSPTLKDLVDRMALYEIPLFVPVIPEVRMHNAHSGS